MKGNYVCIYDNKTGQVLFFLDFALHGFFNMLVTAHIIMRVVAYATHSSVLFCLPLFQLYFNTIDCGFHPLSYIICAAACGGMEEIMKLVILFGAGAVGKMTVGQELMKITDLRLYHNHMDIDPVIEIFGNRNYSAVTRIREVIFDEFVKSDLPGMIFTFMWALDIQDDWDYLDRFVDIFRRNEAEIYYVELVASQKIRLQRNATENRLQHKASKRDIDASNERLKNEDAHYRLVSNDGEFPFEKYIKIDNSNLSPDVVAKMIKERFLL